MLHENHCYLQGRDASAASWNLDMLRTFVGSVSLNQMRPRSVPLLTICSQNLVLAARVWPAHICPAPFPALAQNTVRPLLLCSVIGWSACHCAPFVSWLPICKPTQQPKPATPTMRDASIVALAWRPPPQTPPLRPIRLLRPRCWQNQLYG